MTDRSCSAKNKRVYGNCERRASVEVDGKWYCWQHDPVRLRAKARREWEARKAQMRAEDEAYEARHARKALLAAAGLRDLSAVSDDDLRALAAAGGLSAWLEAVRTGARGTTDENGRRQAAD